MPKLYVLSGPDVGKSFEVSSGALVGRDPDCAVRLRDPSVSRRHARVEHDANGWAILDTQSRNGIHVAKARVPRLALDDGAEFTLGEVLMRFRADAARVPATPMTPPIPATASASAHEASRANPADVVRDTGDVADRGEIDEVDEIVLEGEWDAPAREAPALEPGPQTAFAPRAMPPAPSSPPAVLSPSPSRGTVAPPARTADVRAAEAGVPLARASGGIATRAGDAASTNRAVLQYGRIHDRPGFFNADLAQQPLWLKLVLALAALAVFLALFWFAFKSTSFLKGKAVHGTDESRLDENG
jgi:predicted component of type VI protein secretion system